jgi:hypothetical protein
MGVLYTLLQMFEKLKNNGPERFGKTWDDVARIMANGFNISLGDSWTHAHYLAWFHKTQWPILDIPFRLMQGNQKVQDALYQGYMHAPTDRHLDKNSSPKEKKHVVNEIFDKVDGAYRMAKDMAKDAAYDYPSLSLDELLLKIKQKLL